MRFASIHLCPVLHCPHSGSGPSRSDVCCALRCFPIASVLPLPPRRYWVYSPSLQVCWLSSTIPYKFTGSDSTLDRNRGPRCSAYIPPPPAPAAPPSPLQSPPVFPEPAGLAWSDAGLAAVRGDLLALHGTAHSSGCGLASLSITYGFPSANSSVTHGAAPPSSGGITPMIYA